MGEWCSLRSALRRKTEKCFQYCAVTGILKGRKCDTQQGHTRSPAALSNAEALFYSSTPPPFPPTAHLSRAPQQPLTSGHVCMALIGEGATSSVGGIPAWAQWAVPAEHLYTRALGKLQVTSTKPFLQCRDTQTAGAVGEKPQMGTLL